MFKDQQQRSMMWETTVRKTQQQQQLPSGRRRGCGIFPAASVVPSGDGDFSGNSSGGASPTTPSKSSDELYPEEKTYHAERLLPNGDFYTGLWCGNLPHGAGKYLWTDGCMYEGDWIQGKTTGVGKFSWPSGATYEGEFKTGFMDGTGTYTGAGGETYRGTWCMNLKHGRGKKSYANGDYYDGEWRGGVQDGQGRYIWKNCNEYSGGWKGGTIHGRGRLSWANGNEYSGEFEDGIPCGKGQFRWADTSKYVGIWCRDGTVKKGVFFPSPAAASEKDLREAFDMDMGEWQVCAGETVSILPSQKTVDWSWMESEFLHKQAAWRSAKATDGGSGCGTRRRDSSNSLLGGGLEALCLWDPQERDGSGDGTAVRESNASGEMKWAPREVKKQGETISKGHKNYELMLNLQLGIRHSVGKPAPATTFDLKASAFDPKEKVWTKFPPEGTKQTPPHQSCEFKWKDYCPVVFRTLRKLFKIDAADYMLSICGNDALRELSSPGKSGSFFYLTHDDRYMIKTVKKSEVKVLLRMLPAYYNHVRAFENTLVTKFFGLHCVKLTGATQKKVRFVIMGNLFCSEYPIHRRFDLKGSSHGRTTDKPEDQIDETTTLKDLDLNFMFRLQKSWFLEFQRQVDRDCEFLEQERIMDYSLLVGLHFRDNATATTGDRSSAEISDYGSASEATPRLSRTDLDQFLCDPIRWAAIRLGVNMPARVEQTQRSEGGSPLLGETFDVVLFFGIIDILQDYDISKKLEHAYKSIQYDPTSISAVDPKQYSRRFRDFIFKVFRDDP